MLLYPAKDRIQIGLDEAGRGSLAFEVVAAAVVLPSTKPENIEHVTMLSYIKDSKKMSQRRRNQCAEFIKTYAVAYGIASATHKEIDEWNVYNATIMAMHRAIDTVVSQLKVGQDQQDFIELLVDGDRFQRYYADCLGSYLQHTCVVDGDSIHMNIAAASILAKVERDKQIVQYCIDNPEWDEKYGFRKNKAYGTQQHMDGILKHGILDVHRNTFKPIVRWLNST